MTPEKWEEIKNMVRKQYKPLEEGQEDLLVETAEELVKQGQAEFVVFESPLGRIKLSFQKKPRVEQKKFFYSHRHGDSARVEYKFSDSEMVYVLKAYKWNETEERWKEIDSSSFGQ